MYLPESQSQNIQVFSAVPKGRQNVSIDLSVLEVLRVDQHYPVYRVHMSHVVHKVPFTEVDCDFTIRGTLLEHAGALFFTG